jgi:hypothetical protein
LNRLSDGILPDGFLTSFDRESLAKIANSALAGKAADQWGWRTREHLAPLLNNEAVGDCLVKYVFTPIALGTAPAKTDDHLIGGKLLGVPKPDGSARPIIVGDQDRKVVTKALMRFFSPALAEYFLHSHPRVSQFGIGVTDGAVKTLHTIRSLIPSTPSDPNTPIPPEDWDDPIVVLSLDAKNAFNSISHRAMLDAIYGTASCAYDRGVVQPGDPIPKPADFHALLPCLEMFLHRVNGSTGTQQGDPPSAAMYAVGQHPVLLRVAARHAGIYIAAYADNVYVMGRLTQTLACADDLVTSMSSDLGLSINLNESWVHAPLWAHL